MLITIVSFIFVLGVLVFIHEFGHYIVAKKVGIRVEEFALGFGPKLFSFKKKETVYSIRGIPLGGFCKMTGEFPNEDNLDEKELKNYQKAKENKECFFQQSPLKRFMVIFMGPFMNFMLAVFIFIFIFSVYGIPVDHLQEAIIGEVIPGNPAYEAGLRAGDEILAINGQDVNTWDEMATIIQANPRQEILLTYRRQGIIEEIAITPRYDENTETGAIGILPELIRERISLGESITLGAKQSWYVFRLTVVGFMQMITRQTEAEIAGPVMIASLVGQAAEVGLSNLLNLMAFISINLGIINLLPFPALDGGRIVFIIVEVLRGKPVNPQKEGFVHLIGFVLLLVLMVFVIYQDIVRSIF